MGKQKREGLVDIGNRIVLVVGESGSGKDTLVNAVCEKYGYKRVISYTTRPERNDAKDIQSHIFINNEEFDELENIIAYTEFNGYKYCSTAQQIEESDFYIIDCDGIKYFKEHYKGSKDIITVHIEVPKVDRFLRMEKRDGSVKVMERIKHDEIAFENVNELCDITISNESNDISNAVEMLKEAVEGRLNIN